MSLSVEAWATNRPEMSQTDIEFAHAMANHVMSNALAYLYENREYFRASFLFDEPIHEKALEFFLPQLRDLAGYEPSDNLDVSEETYVDYRSEGDGEDKRYIEIPHKIIRLRQGILEQPGKRLVAECVDWAYEDSETGLSMGHPYAVNYYGEKTL